MTTISYISVILICVYYDFMVTYTDRACDSCVHYYHCEIPVIPRPLAAVLTTQGMLSRLRFVNEFYNIIKIKVKYLILI